MVTLLLLAQSLMCCIHRLNPHTEAVIAAKRRGAYRHHPLALKRSIVEETLKPGASVARIARQHGVNANQVFLWRKAYREGLLPESKPTLLPVGLGSCGGKWACPRPVFTLLAER